MPYSLWKRSAPVAVAMLLILATWSSVLDAPAREQIDAGLQRAFATFAGARALNAAISLFQGTELTVGVVAELTVGIGQVLDPVNDLVERFSDLMLVASVAFGVQKVLLAVGQYEYLKYALTAVLVAWCATRALSAHSPRWLDVALLVLLMLRFAVPVAATGSDAIYVRFLQQDYAESQSAIDALAGDIGAHADTGDVTSLDPRPVIDNMKQLAANATDQVTRLIVVFLVQTLLAPVFLLWALYACLRAAITGGGGAAPPARPDPSLPR